MTSNICSDVVDGEDGSGASAASSMTFCCVRPRQQAVVRFQMNTANTYCQKSRSSCVEWAARKGAQQILEATICAVPKHVRTHDRHSLRNQN
jgi:hypothetical protein